MGKLVFVMPDYKNLFWYIF